MELVEDDLITGEKDELTGPSRQQETHDLYQGPCFPYSVYFPLFESIQLYTEKTSPG